MDSVTRNITRCRELQSEYKIVTIDAAEYLQKGEYAFAAQKYADAARIQLELASLTDGDTRAAHHKAAENLTARVKQIMIDNKLFPKPIDRAAPAPKPVTPPAPSNTGGAAASGGTNTKKTDNELPEDFDPAKYILKPKSGGVTLDTYRTHPELIEELKQDIYGTDFNKRFKRATEGWDEPETTNYLFYGPAGTGKSHLCQAIANSLDEAHPNGESAFFLVESDEVYSMYVGRTEKKLRAIFDLAATYKFAVICFDEIQGLCKKPDGSDKRDYTDTMIQLIHGVRGKTPVMIIGTSNYPWNLAQPMLSRLTRRVFIDYATKRDIYDFFALKKEYRDFLGTTDAEIEPKLETVSTIAADRKLSYRNLNGLCKQIRRVIEKKTIDRYHDDTDIEHIVPIDMDELKALVMNCESDFNEDKYRQYAEFRAGVL